MSSLGGSCSYCGKAKAIHRDHVVSKNDRRRYGISADDKKYHVAACGPCNWAKLTRRLAPPGFEEIVDELNQMMTGPRFRIWNGDPAMLKVTAPR